MSDVHEDWAAVDGRSLYRRQLNFGGIFRLNIRSNDEKMAESAASLFSGASPPPPPDETHRPPSITCFIDATRARLRRRLTVSIGGQAPFVTTSESRALWFMEGIISDRLARALTEYHLFHAGAVVMNGRGILMPGSSGAGKSTSVAALSLSGAACYSDEVAVLDENLRLHPFPKVLSLKPGGWQRIRRDFRTETAQGVIGSSRSRAIHFVRPPVIPGRDGHPITSAVDYVILPSRAQGKLSVLKPVSKSVAITTLMSESFDLSLKGARGFDLLVRLAQQSECYSLEVSDNVTSTVRAISELTGQTTL